MKVIFEEGTSAMRVLRMQIQGSAADTPQCALDWSVVAGVRIFAQRSAACQIGCECGEVFIGWPACELHPFNRFELAACKFQWFLG